MKDILAITCGIFQAEMAVLAPRFPRLLFGYADSMLHMRPDLLQTRIDELLAEHPSGKVLFIYGDCTPRIVELCRRPGFAKTAGINCCEIVLGREEYRRLRKAGAFFSCPSGHCAGARSSNASWALPADGEPEICCARYTLISYIWIPAPYLCHRRFCRISAGILRCP